MSRTRYRYDVEAGSLVEIGVGQGGQPHFHAVHQDSMDPTWHPLTGRYMESKSKFREITRANGYTEIGTEKYPERRERNTSGDIDRAIRRALGNE